MKSYFNISRILFLLVAVSISLASKAQGITVNARVYLEGALINSTSVGETNLRPLMRDDLRFNPYNSQRVIPDQDIYKVPYIVNSFTKVDVTPHYTHVGPGALPQYTTISDPFTVFAVSGENAIVDWIFVELRDKNDYTSVLATRSGLVQRDGDIVDLDGTSGLLFDNMAEDFYFVVVRHRSHLGVMTKFPLPSSEIETLVDFTDPDTPTFDFGNTGNEYNYSGLAQKSLQVVGEDKMALWAGDFDGDGVICYIADNSDCNVMQHEVAGFDLNLNPMYKVTFNGSVGYLQSDYDMSGKVKFTPPEDDRNLVLEQVLFYSQNTEVRTNFGNLIQQIPN